MKKLFVAFISAVLCFSLFAFVGCDEGSAAASFEEIEVGYNLPVYPDFEFDYKVSDDCIVHINKIKIELTDKNIIEPNETVSSPYWPYIFHVSASGSTDAKYAGKTIYLILINKSVYRTQFYYETTIGDDGSIYWDYDQAGTQSWTLPTKIYFHMVTFDW